ncbi:uncharacterized protein LOC134299561 [Anolis carolinensis]|uniref:uncharacterized protein LOC134299561 n=1 Tax=Anolis carolinensis TaxID=28377 RepID=UPI002F2B34FB
MEDFEQKNEKIEKLEELQEKLEQNEREFQLRFRNVQEEAKEDIRQLIIKMLANLLKRTEENMDNEIDKTYRVQTNFSRRNKVARDIIVHFVKKRIRDEILIQNSRNPMYHKGKKVIVLKEFPQATLNRRRKFFFLTDELKRLRIRFHWEKKEGIMVTYKEEKHWLTSEDKAKDFYKRYIKGKSETPSESTPPSVKRKKAKRARYHSEEKQKFKTDSFYKLVNVTDEGEEEGSEEEEERDTKEVEVEEEGSVSEKEQESEDDKARMTPVNPHENDDEKVEESDDKGERPPGIPATFQPEPLVPLANAGRGTEQREAAVRPPGPQGGLRRAEHWGLPPQGPQQRREELKIEYGGESSELDFFLTTVRGYMEDNGHTFRTESSRVRAIGAVLRRGAAGWYVQLHARNDPCLGSVRRFLAALEERFRDPLERIQAREKLKTICQGQRSVSQYAEEFQCLAERIPEWSEVTKLEIFKEGLRCEVLIWAAHRDDPGTLRGWIQLAGRVEATLAQVKRHRGDQQQQHPKPKREGRRSEQPPTRRQAEVKRSGGGARKECFVCGRAGRGKEEGAISPNSRQQQESVLKKSKQQGALRRNWKKRRRKSCQDHNFWACTLAPVIKDADIITLIRHLQLSALKENGCVRAGRIVRGFLWAGIVTLNMGEEYIKESSGVDQQSWLYMCVQYSSVKFLVTTERVSCVHSEAAGVS